MNRRKYRRQSGQWLVPGIMVVGLAGFFAWQFEWIPIGLEVADGENFGSISDESGPNNGSDAFDLDDNFGSSDSVPGVDGTDVIFPDQSEPSLPGTPLEASIPSVTDITSSDDSEYQSSPFDSIPPVATADNSNSPPTDLDRSVPAGGTRAPDGRQISFEEWAAERNAMRSGLSPGIGNRTVSDSPTLPNEKTAADDPIRNAGFTDQERPSDGNSFATFEESTPTPADALKLSMVERLKQIDELIERGDVLTAHFELSSIYWKQEGDRELIRERIQSTATSIFASQQPHVVEPYEVQPGDTLQKIAGRYDVPWTYLSRLNRVDERRIRPGQKLKVMRGPFNALIDLSEFELTIHAHGYYVHHYPIGIGADRTTPIGKFAVSEKLDNPTWFDPDGGVVEGDDPSNPLGERWIAIGNGYGIHGTIDPDSIGSAASRGCVRMHNDDVTEVFDLLTVGSEVVIKP